MEASQIKICRKCQPAGSDSDSNKCNIIRLVFFPVILVAPLFKFLIKHIPLFGHGVTAYRQQELTKSFPGVALVAAASELIGKTVGTQVKSIIHLQLKAFSSKTVLSSVFDCFNCGA